jgi:hypothetical protein
MVLKDFPYVYRHDQRTFPVLDSIIRSMTQSREKNKSNLTRFSSSPSCLQTSSSGSASKYLGVQLPGKTNCGNKLFGRQSKFRLKYDMH